MSLTNSAGADLISSTVPAAPNVGGADTPAAPPALTQTPGEYDGEAESRESGRKWRHRLTNIRPDERVADCANCGPGVPLRYRAHRDRWACREGDRARTPEARARRSRNDHLRRKFGITESDYVALLEAQGGVCAICLQPCATRRNLAVDHDHETGRVRGLLCNQCNRAIGLLRDDTARLQRAVAYLAK